MKKKHKIGLILFYLLIFIVGAKTGYQEVERKTDPTNQTQKTEYVIARLPPQIIERQTIRATTPTNTPEREELKKRTYWDNQLAVFSIAIKSPLIVPAAYDLHKLGYHTGLSVNRQKHLFTPHHWITAATVFLLEMTALFTAIIGTTQFYIDYFTQYIQERNRWRRIYIWWKDTKPHIKTYLIHILPSTLLLAIAAVVEG